MRQRFKNSAAFWAGGHVVNMYEHLFIYLKNTDYFKDYLHWTVPTNLQNFQSNTVWIWAEQQFSVAQAMLPHDINYVTFGKILLKQKYLATYSRSKQPMDIFYIKYSALPLDH